MKTKRFIEISPRAFKEGHISQSETTTNILKSFSDSKRFNAPNFFTGVWVGLTLAYVIIEFLL